MWAWLKKRRTISRDIEVVNCESAPGFFMRISDARPIQVRLNVRTGIVVEEVGAATFVMKLCPFHPLILPQRENGHLICSILFFMRHTRRPFMKLD